MDPQTAGAVARIKELKASIGIAEQELQLIENEMTAYNHDSDKRMEIIRENSNSKFSKLQSVWADEHSADLNLTAHFQEIANKSCINALEEQNNATLQQEYGKLIQETTQFASKELERREIEYKDKHRVLLTETLRLDEEKSALKLSEAIIRYKERIEELKAQLN
jgi:hypothetical protein